MKAIAYFTAVVFVCSVPASSQELIYENSLLWNSPLGIRASGDYVYCCYPYGLEIVDIGDPANPAEVGRISLNSRIDDFDVRGNYAYLIADSLFVIDLSDPLNPVRVGAYHEYEFGGRAVSANDSLVFVEAGRVAIYDIADSGSLNFINEDWLAAENICAGERYLNGIADYENELRIIDPYTLNVIGSDSVNNYSRHIFARDDKVFVTDHIWGLQVFSISDPRHPTLIGENYPADGWPNAVYAEGPYAYMATESAVEICSGLAGWQSIFSYPIETVSCGAWKSGNNLLVASATGFDVIDVTDPFQPVGRGRHSSPGRINKLVARGGYAYLVSWFRDLQIVDLTGDNPVARGWLELPGWALDIDVEGNYAYIATQIPNDGAMEIVDISNPDNLAMVGGCDMPTYPTAISVQDSFAYMAGRQSGVQVIDISDPSTPAIVAQLDHGFGAYGILAEGDYLFVANCWSGLLILGISDPLNPELIVECALSGCARGFNIKDTLLFVACQYGPLQIVNIADIFHPVSIANYDYACDEVLIDGDWALLAGGDIKLLDISNPLSPRLQDEFATLGAALDIARSGDRYVVVDYDALLLLRMAPDAISESNDPPVHFALLPNYPNPFNAHTTISYSLPADFTGALAIYDIAGRLVRTLDLAPGSSNVTWDGANNNGRPVASGIYFYALAGRPETARKMVLLR